MNKSLNHSNKSFTDLFGNEILFSVATVLMWHYLELFSLSFSQRLQCIHWTFRVLHYSSIWLPSSLSTTFQLIDNCSISNLSFSSPANLQEKLTDFLPKLLDCSTEIKSFHDHPKLPSYSTLELCERYGRVMTSLTLSRTPADGRWAAQTSSPLN